MKQKWHRKVGVSMQEVPFQFIKLCHITDSVLQSTSCEGDSTRRNTVHNSCSSLISTELQHVQTLRALATQSAIVKRVATAVHHAFNWSLP